MRPDQKDTQLAYIAIFSHDPEAKTWTTFIVDGNNTVIAKEAFNLLSEALRWRECWFVDKFNVQPLIGVGYNKMGMPVSAIPDAMLKPIFDKITNPHNVDASDPKPPEVDSQLNDECLPLSDPALN